MDLAHGNMEGTQGSLLPLPLGCKLPDWLSRLPSPAQKQSWDSHSIIYWLRKLDL